MNKPIFQKIKKSHLSSITQSPSSQQKIQYMSVQDMQKTLLTQMNSSRDPSQNIMISTNSDSWKGKQQTMSYSSPSKNSVVESKRIPEIVLENDQLKQEIQQLKSEKNMILSQYQNLSTFTRNYSQLQSDKKQIQRQFSFRKSVQNAHKLISSSHQQQTQKPTRQPGIRQQRHLTSNNQRNIPSSDENNNRNSRQQQTSRRSGSLSSSKGIFGNVRKSINKETFSTLEERFYQYCKTEMVRMNTENTKLTLRIGELEGKISSMQREYELIQGENTQLKSMNQTLEERLKAENEKIDKINQTMSVTLAKKQQIIDSEFKLLQTQLNQLRTQQQSLRKQLNQKQSQLMMLKSQFTKKSAQTKNYAQLVARNASLQNQLNQLMVRNKKLSDKFRRMPVIDHLWEIKEVEYENLVNFIKQEKGELDSLEKSMAYQTNRLFSNIHDLTFSKDKRNP